VASGISKRVSRQRSQSACPFNVKFARELAEPAFAPREALAGKDARTLARELVGITPDGFRATYTGSPMKRAKLRGLKRRGARDGARDGARGRGRRDLAGEARLPHPAGAGQRDEARAAEQRTHPGQIARAAHEARERHGHGVGRGGRRAVAGGGLGGVGGVQQRGRGWRGARGTARRPRARSSTLAAVTGAL